MRYSSKEIPWLDSPNVHSFARSLHEVGFPSANHNRKSQVFVTNISRAEYTDKVV